MEKVAMQYFISYTSSLMEDIRLKVPDTDFPRSLRSFLPVFLNWEDIRQ